MRIMEGKNPPRPTEAECDEVPITDDLWDLVNQCWDPTPRSRPAMSAIVATLGERLVQCDSQLSPMNQVDFLPHTHAHVGVGAGSQGIQGE
jgi:hypothetical protein